MGQSVVFKVAAECNLRCSYCYWFADPNVLNGRSIASKDVCSLFVDQVSKYLADCPKETLTISLHGGEPLLIGKSRFSWLCDELRSRAGERVRLACQTNGTLIDQEWVSIFRYFKVQVGVSIDGPPTIHNARRLGKHGAGSYDHAKRGFDLLQNAGLDPGILAVWSPVSSAREIVEHFVNGLGVSWFDVLLMDATNDQITENCAEFYCQLFDIWLTELQREKVTVRICEAITRALLGLHSGMESIGRGPVTTFGVSSDGNYQLLDVLNVAGCELSKTPYSLVNMSIEEFLHSPAYASQVAESNSISAVCEKCRFANECGGGYFPSRWSRLNGFKNPSAHCTSLFQIFDYCEERLQRELRNLNSC